MRPGRTLLFLLTMLFFAAQDVSAQRVRVTVGPDRTVGTLESFTDTSLVLKTPSGLLAFSARNTTRLEQSTGRKPNLVVGAVGLVLGVAVGGAVGCAVNSDSYGVFCGGQDDTKVIVGAAAGGIAGAVLGSMMFKREKWRLVEAPWRFN